MDGKRKVLVKEDVRERGIHGPMNSTWKEEEEPGSFWEKIPRERVRNTKKMCSPTS
jgi:hypothetical protein